MNEDQNNKTFENIPVYQGIEVDLLKDTLAQLQTVTRRVNQSQPLDQDAMRRELNKYYELKKKFEGTLGLTRESQLGRTSLSKVSELTRDFQELVEEFELKWRDEISTLVGHTYELSLQEKEESQYLLKDMQEIRHTSTADFDLKYGDSQNGEETLIAQVNIDKERFRSKSVLSISGLERPACCRCTVF